jgi:hypothetical protein
MSARHRQHKRRIREAESDLDENEKDLEAVKRVMNMLIADGKTDSHTYGALWWMLNSLRKDRWALLAIMQVLETNGAGVCANSGERHDLRTRQSVRLPLGLRPHRSRRLRLPRLNPRPHRSVGA